MELFKASEQWSKRPADERFWGIQDGYEAVRAYRKAAREKLVNLAELRVENLDGDLSLVGKARIPATLTHWAFGQVAKTVGAPAGYLRKLPATLAAQNINHGLKNANPETVANVLFHQNGNFVARAVTSESYARIWNEDLFEKLLDLPDGWRVPPARPAVGDPRARPATERDVLSRAGTSAISISVGDMIAPAGVYVSDHDCFVFLINEGKAIDDGTEDGLRRGFFAWNSEVGASVFGVTSFLFDYVCGNHIVWGASNVFEMKVRHSGEKAFGKAMRGLGAEIRKLEEGSEEETEKVISAARKLVLGASPDEVIDAILSFATKKNLSPLTKKVVVSGYDRAVEREDRYGNPKTLWAIVNGLTEVSQETGFADTRTDLDRAAGKLLSLAV